MAVGDRVALTIGSQNLTTLAPLGLKLGRIVFEDAGPPVLADVLWDDGIRMNGLDRDQALVKVFIAGDTDVTLFHRVGRFVQLTDWPLLGQLADAPPKSPAAAGLVHRGVGFNPDFTANVPTTTWVEMSWYDGRMRALVPAPSDLVDPGVSALQDVIRDDPRRVIGKASF